MTVDYQLFIDLDGVLVDFDGGVTRAAGRPPSELRPSEMWPVLARTPGFYARLDWLEGGRDLWEAVRPFGPAVLTGLPMGKWAEPQKREWCGRELGADVPVITGFARDKPALAAAWMEERGLAGRRPLLVDDRLKTQEPWEDAGGVFVLHLDAGRTLGALRDLGALPS